jgi:hypothetical protein
MATFLLSKPTNTVYGFSLTILGRFNVPIGSSRIANSAYHNWPTDISDSSLWINQTSTIAYAFKV